MGRTQISPSTTTTLSSMVFTPRMATSGWLMMGVKLSMPYMPRLVMVKVPPVRRSMGRPPLRASVASSLTSAEISVRLFLSASRTLGDDEAVVERHGHAHVDVVLVDDLVVLHRAVEQGELGEGLGHDLDEDVRIAEALDLLALKLLAQPLQLRHVDAEVEGDGGAGHVRIEHVAGDGLPHAVHGHGLLARPGLGGGGAALLHGGEDVCGQHAAVRGHVLQVEADVGGDLGRERAGLDGRLCRRGRGGGGGPRACSSSRPPR